MSIAYTYRIMRGNTPNGLRAGQAVAGESSLLHVFSLISSQLSEVVSETAPLLKGKGILTFCFYFDFMVVIY